MKMNDCLDLERDLHWRSKLNLLILNTYVNVICDDSFSLACYICMELFEKKVFNN